MEEWLFGHLHYCGLRSSWRRWQMKKIKKNHDSWFSAEFSQKSLFWPNFDDRINSHFMTEVKSYMILFQVLAGHYVLYWCIFNHVVSGTSRPCLYNHIHNLGGGDGIPCRQVTHSSASHAVLAVRLLDQILRWEWTKIMSGGAAEGKGQQKLLFFLRGLPFLAASEI